MNKRPAFRFVSCLPRSGSTLLCNILAQNPRHHSTQTSGCLDVLFGARNHWDTLIEHKAHPVPEKKINVLRSILYAYYQDVDKDIIFDKSRGWMAYLEMVEEIMQEKAKLLVCIRPIPDILASLEKLNRKTAKIKQPPGEAKNYFQFQSQEGRCEYWLSKEQLIGIAYTRIMDAVDRGYRDRMHFIQYHDLTYNPKQTMQKVYDFLEEPYYEHDFNNVEQVTQEDDTLHGYIDLHTIQPKVEYRPSDAEKIIGKNLVEKYSRYNIDLSKLK